MRPNDTYAFVAQTFLTPDEMSLVKCYQPIIGLPAFSLYHYLWAYFDNGAGRYHFSQILNHLGFGMQTLEQALQVLTAMDLLAMYEEEQDVILLVKNPLSVRTFLQHPLYQALLAQKIGEAAVEQMKSVLPPSEKNISKTFSEVFQLDGSVEPLKVEAERFDIVAFQQMMARHQLRFQEEKEDTIALYHLAEQYHWTWLEAYQIARETAIDGVLSTKRMQEKMTGRAQLETKHTTFSTAEAALIRESKAKSALEFLSAIKTSRKATVIASERACLKRLAELGLLDEVINVLVLYTFNRVDSANLNEKYALKLGNDFAYREIRTAEAAVEALREGTPKQTSKTQKKTNQSNVPEWSNPDYKDETTAEDLAALEKIQREILANLEKGE